MSRTHTNQDVYVDNALAATNAQVIENPEQDRVRVKARVSGRPGVWAVTIELNDAERQPDAQGDTGVIRSWSGVDSDGAHRTVSALGRVKPCCGRR